MRKHYTTSERLKLWRAVKGYSVRGLADESGVCRSPLWRFEQGKQSPHERHIQAITKALRISMTDFYSDDALARAIADSKRKAAA